MKKINNIILVFIILLLNCTAHCKSLQKNYFIKQYDIYKTYEKELRKNNFFNAIHILETIKKNNITHIRKDKIQINLIYAYYKNSNLNMAKKNIKEFIHFYPNHPNIDYVIYIQCLINMNLEQQKLLKILPIKHNNYNINYVINAFFQFKNFVLHYPKSLYTINAKKNLIYLQNRLAEYDFQILKFYFSHKEYIAVVNRGEEIIQKYPNTLFARKSLIYMRQSYTKLKIFDTAEKISKIILLNHIY